MKLPYFLIALALFVAFVGGLWLICKNASNYSPMDNYVRAVVKEAADSARHAEPVKKRIPYCACNDSRRYVDNCALCSTTK